jgi:hypothetical protein
MSLDVNTRLRQVSSNLKQLQNTINPTFLEPARLQWESYLESVRILGLTFQKLIESIPPEFRYFVVYPVQYKSASPDIDTTELLCSGDVSQLISEATNCKKRYLEKIAELGLSDAKPEDRRGFLSDQIHGHNLLCEEGAERIQQRINEFSLKDTTEPFTQIRALQNDKTGILQAMLTGDNLPVAQDLRQ